MIVILLILNSALGLASSSFIFRLYNKWLKSLHRETVDKTEMEILLTFSFVFGLPVSALCLIYCSAMYAMSVFGASNLTAWARAKDIEEDSRPRFEELLRENRRLKDELANKRLLGL